MPPLHEPKLRELRERLSGSPYLNYLYAYPHKTTYRALPETQSLQAVWQQEDKSALFLYVHIPFCEMRCGFCNLFTTANPQAEMVTRYLDQLERQAIQTQQALGSFTIANMAMGGGTPTYLTAPELVRLFAIATEHMGVDIQNTPLGIETSPATVTEDRLQVLEDHAVNRISLGVESFLDKEAHALGRPQQVRDVERALTLIGQSAIETLNIDLIYGGEGQSLTSWLESVEQAVAWQAQEIYLYPLYVRPLTGLGRKGAQQWDDQRLAAYWAARDRLLASGYEQYSMRLFRRVSVRANQGEYHCQEDGMIGLGCGARSYTRQVHYSSEYAVKRQGVLGIIQHYNQLESQALAEVNYGFRLNADEQHRRYTLLSLLQCEGLQRADYVHQFGEDVLNHLPQLSVLEEAGVASIDAACIRLNPQGIAYSDVIGTWLYSDAVHHLMAEYPCR